MSGVFEYCGGSPSSAPTGGGWLVGLLVVVRAVVLSWTVRPCRPTHSLACTRRRVNSDVTAVTRDVLPVLALFSELKIYDLIHFVIRHIQPKSRRRASRRHFHDECNKSGLWGQSALNNGLI